MGFFLALDTYRLADVPVPFCFEKENTMVSLAEWKMAVKEKWPTVPTEHLHGPNLPEAWPDPDTLESVARALLRAKDYVQQVTFNENTRKDSLHSIQRCIRTVAPLVAAQRGIKIQ
jgi:hypothetical protein